MGSSWNHFHIICKPKATVLSYIWISLAIMMIDPKTNHMAFFPQYKQAFIMSWLLYFQIENWALLLQIVKWITSIWIRVQVLVYLKTLYQRKTK